MRYWEIERAAAISYTALSVNESTVLWTLARPWGGEICQCRVIVAFEFENYSDFAFRPSLRNDPTGIAKASELGLVTGGPKGAHGTSKAQRAGGDEIALFFEWVVAHRRGDLLDNFSIGPTQQWLANSSLHRGQGAGACGFFEEWEHLWGYYLAYSVEWGESNAGVVLADVTYLDPGTCIDQPYPADAPGDPRENSIRWLTRHTGNRPTATKYYDGTLPSMVNDPSKAYKNALFVTTDEANKIGY